MVSCYSPRDNKDLEFTGIIINKKRGEHYIPELVVKSSTGDTKVIDVSCYVLPDRKTTLFNYVHIGDSIWKENGNYSVKILSKSDGKIHQFEFWYKGEWYYDGHD